MTTDTRRPITALRTSQDRLASAVASLSPEEIRGPSYDTEWSIAQVLSHLGSQAELFEARLQGTETGTAPPTREAMQAMWDAWNGRAPEEQVADSLAYNERLVQQLEQLSDDQLAAMRLALFGMEVDGFRLAQMRLAEHALHTWDVAVALDPDARVSPDAVDLLIDILPGFVARAGKPQGNSFRLHVHTTEPVRDFLLTVGDTVTLIPWDGSPADGDLLIPAEAFLRLVYGRLDPAHTPPLELVAPDVTLDDLRQVFPGF